jgi:hypothetical protein
MFRIIEGERAAEAMSHYDRPIQPVRCKKYVETLRGARHEIVAFDRWASVESGERHDEDVVR